MVRTLSWSAATLAILASLIVVGVRAQNPTPPPEQNRPGYPSLAKVFVLNTRPEEAVPVSIEANRYGPLPVSIAGVVPVSTAIQRWEYRQLKVRESDDPTGALNALGTDGWEAVTSIAAKDGAVIVLKRPR